MVSPQPLRQQEPEPAPPPEAATRKEKVGSNKILAPVELPLVEETGGSVTGHMDLQLRRDQQTPPRGVQQLLRSAAGAAVAEDSSPALAETEAKLNAAISGGAEDRTLRFSATLADGTQLPQWLVFDAPTRSFHGTPSKGDGGIVPVRLTAQDSKGKSISESFLLNVTGGSPPKSGGPLIPLHHFEKAPKAAIGRNFYYKVPPSTFGYANGETGPVSYRAQRGDGGPLPAWLHFDRASGTFSGMPRATDTGPFSVEVFARDAKGSLSSDSFTIDVVSSDLESVVLRDADLRTTPGSHNFWIMMMCVSLIFFAAVILVVAVGVFGFKVSIKRRFMRENKEQKPGTLRHVECCGAEPLGTDRSNRRWWLVVGWYDQYSSIHKDDIEILAE
eukprot:Skav207836  [mRNA]  locus=scaffold2005:92733:123267:+ [translate_table: standard]